MKFNIYDLYRYKKRSNKGIKYRISASSLVLEIKDIIELKKKKIKLDNHTKKLLVCLTENQIDLIFILFDKKNIIHSSGIHLNKETVLDKFFYNFQRKKYAVISNVHTNKNYRKKNYYSLALKKQIKILYNIYKIKDLYISTNRLNFNPSPLKHNNFINCGSGFLISFFDFLFFFITYSKNLKVRIFINHFLIW